MKNLIFMVLFIVSNLLYGQENKSKFYDRLQIVSEYQIGKQKVIYLTSDPHILNSEDIETSIFRIINAYGVNISFKNKFFSTGVGYNYVLAPKEWWIHSHRVQYNLSGNLLYFLKASSDKLGIYLGPSIILCGDFDYFRKKLVLGYGFEFSIFNFWIKFSRFDNKIVGYDESIIFDKSSLFSIGYAISFNTFRKKENKRYD